LTRLFATDKAGELSGKLFRQIPLKSKKKLHIVADSVTIKLTKYCWKINRCKNLFTTIIHSLAHEIPRNILFLVTHLISQKFMSIPVFPLQCLAPLFQRKLLFLLTQ
jgi:hypothetical protein